MWCIRNRSASFRIRLFSRHFIAFDRFNCYTWVLYFFKLREFFPSFAYISLSVFVICCDSLRTFFTPSLQIDFDENTYFYCVSFFSSWAIWLVRCEKGQTAVEYVPRFVRILAFFNFLFSAGGIQKKALKLSKNFESFSRFLIPNIKIFGRLGLYFCIVFVK